jgi:hypothetical protein
MSANYRVYVSKMAELRARRAAGSPLQGQLHELFVFVMRCEARWQ